MKKNTIKRITSTGKHISPKKPTMHSWYKNNNKSINHHIKVFNGLGLPPLLPEGAEEFVLGYDEVTDGKNIIDI